MNKKGENEVLEEVIFTVLNIVFIVIFLLFVSRASSGALALEQLSAKQIALILDNSYSGQIIKIDLTEESNLAKKNKVDIEKIVRINDNKVITQLSGSGSYSFPYFNDVSVETAYEINDKTFLILSIGEKND